MSDDLDDQIDPVTPRRSPFGSPRFARLVDSPVGRRLSPRRLGGGILLGGCLLWGVAELGSRAAAGVKRWVAAQPEHQISFDQIELDPPAPPYIRQGAAGILASVRAEAKYDTSVSVLDIDLDALRIALSRNPWIENVGSVRSSYRHLAAKVVYRKPVATILCESESTPFVVVDRNGVVVPSEPGQIDWADPRSRSRVAGNPAPLLKLRGLGDPVGDRLGLIWRSTSLNIDDAKVVQAARLADFVTSVTAAKTPKGHPTPEFAFAIYHREPRAENKVEITGFFLRDTQNHWIFWNSGPGAEPIGELDSARKWGALCRFLDDHGPLSFDPETQFLSFTSGAAEVIDFQTDEATAQVPLPEAAHRRPAAQTDRRSKNQPHR